MEGVQLPSLIEKLPLLRLRLRPELRREGPAREWREIRTRELFSRQLQPSPTRWILY